MKVPRAQPNSGDGASLLEPLKLGRTSRKREGAAVAPNGDSRDPRSRLLNHTPHLVAVSTDNFLSLGMN
ncbi:MAG: hypothetical protein LBF87_08855, partial [Treponema sp.]|nr:hypothetical protein [Treponema sp.]